MRIISLLLTLLLIIVGIAFAALNAKAVEINYLIGQTELPLAALLLISLIVGILISVLLLGSSMIKLKTKNKWLESKVKRIQDS
ncbi:lipopolysaccharide assembly protein LapA domain-containing protein [Candidatus Berkiella aquae]|uniref:LapA family protein n=1 Tax=Candidatus Berkiella aquae TaxID=295108 RepID=A0A0Q9YP71_9GAMM|nr:LapA family protein [Candidatus Berkiella aquae]MCS5712021.1 LapA family protein [Candidatus Berkiella aquae]